MKDSRDVTVKSSYSHQIPATIPRNALINSIWTFSGRDLFKKKKKKKLSRRRDQRGATQRGEKASAVQISDFLLSRQCATGVLVFIHQIRDAAAADSINRRLASSLSWREKQVFGPFDVTASTPPVSTAQESTWHRPKTRLRVVNTMAKQW